MVNVDAGPLSGARATSKNVRKGREANVLVRLNERQLIGFAHPKAASPLATMPSLIARFLLGRFWPEEIKHGTSNLRSRSRRPPRVECWP